MSKTIPSQILRKAKLLADPTCRKCGQTKTVADFPDKAVDYACNACRRVYARASYHKQRAKLTPDELEALKAKVRARQNAWRAERLTMMPPDELEAFRGQLNRGNTERRLKVRDAVYRAYGGYVCKCCGETEPKFLSIDHINNDGAEHRRSNRLQTGEQLYRWLVRNKFPSGFQILCMNCQWGKRNNRGVCPHQERCNDYPARE